jgi:hypothetical protein
MSAGKGSKPRPVDGDKYRANYDAIFQVGRDLRARRTAYVDHLASIPGKDLLNMIDAQKLQSAFPLPTDDCQLPTPS